jgi:peptidoglycan pentaglycine glycine transferase (the first glycine)
LSEKIAYVENIDREEFDDFVKNHPLKSHFMQSSTWGEFNELQRGLKAHRIGLKKGENLCAAVLLLERKPRFFPGYFYAPRGYVVDFFDRELLNKITEYTSEYCKTKGAMFFRIDPDIERHEIDADGVRVKGGFDNTEVFENLIRLGFKHRGFNKGFDRTQPRNSFRIDLSIDEDEILGRISKTILKNVRKGSGYPSEIYKGKRDDIKKFCELIRQTSEREDYYAYPDSYYENFYKILGDAEMVTLYMGKLFPGEIVKKLERDLKNIEVKKISYKKEHHLREAELSINRLKREIPYFRSQLEKHGEEVVASAHLVVHWGFRSWAVHAGSLSDMKESFINNRVYLEKILDRKRAGDIWIDQFGTSFDPDNENLKGIHEFKKQFGGRPVEFIGEFDYVIKPFWYLLYQKAIPIYRNVVFDIKSFLRKIKKLFKSQS